ncbi:MAG: hypothetical protein ACE5HE_11500, partial [Phycisphaerae bacterium]
MLVKICGITSIADGRNALDAGADWIGLNLVGGPRLIQHNRALTILSGLADLSRAVVLISLEAGRPSAASRRFLRSCGAGRL